MNVKCEEQLKRIAVKTVSFGSMTVRIYAPEELQEAQLGYSVDPDGNSLLTAEAGSWQENWLVIGYEDLCGDPIFVDVQAEGCRVYTAIQGSGSWEPTLIADDLESFGRALVVISRLAEGRDNPVELESNPLPKGEIEEAIREIQQYNPKTEVGFWRDWLSL